jgi:hypothetical protein
MGLARNGFTRWRQIPCPHYLSRLLQNPSGVFAREKSGVRIQESEYEITRPERGFPF